MADSANQRRFLTSAFMTASSNYSSSLERVAVNAVASLIMKAGKKRVVMKLSSSGIVTQDQIRRSIKTIPQPLPDSELKKIIDF